MGGRGTFGGNQPTRGLDKKYKILGYIPFTYKTVKMIADAKVLVGIDDAHSLPVEAHTKGPYIKLRPDGTFHEMRIYNDERLLIKEIAYHPEPSINKGDRKTRVLHIHDFLIPGDFSTGSRKVRRLTTEEVEIYKKYLVGVPL